MVKEVLLFSLNLQTKSTTWLIAEFSAGIILRCVKTNFRFLKKYKSFGAVEKYTFSANIVKINEIIIDLKSLITNCLIQLWCLSSKSTLLKASALKILRFSAKS